MLYQVDFDPEDPDATREIGLGWQIGSPYVGGGLAHCAFINNGCISMWVQSDSAYSIAERYDDGIDTRVRWINLETNTKHAGNGNLLWAPVLPT